MAAGYTAKMSHYVILLVALSPALVSGFFFRFRNTDQTKAFRIPYPNIDMDTSNIGRPPPNVSRNMPYYRNIALKYTADQRCLQGMPLGVAIYQLEPYASSLPYPFMRFPQVGMEYFDIFPALLRKALLKCCHANSSVEFLKILTSQVVDTNTGVNETEFDLYMPLYGETMQDTKYKDNAFIPILAAPGVALVVPVDDSKIGNTWLIVTTILKKFPLLIFIILTASTSGIVIWFLEHKNNKEEFTTSFIRGAWEGFWWAFITMTTVGYGDRTPRSFLGRLFCCIWIIFGVVVFSIFSGLVTANIYAGTQNEFEIRGAKIGSVGTAEFKLGVTLNANMQRVRSSSQLATKLMSKEIDGMFIDSYIATFFGKEISSRNMRRDRIIDHPITYGIMLRSNTTYIEGCIRKFIMDNPQEVFEMIRKSVHPKKNKADRENLRLKETKKLFNQDETFSWIIKIEAIVLGVLLPVGILYQVIKSRNLGNKEKFSSHLVNESGWRRGSFKKVDAFEELVEQYKSFEKAWSDKVNDLHE